MGYLSRTIAPAALAAIAAFAVSPGQPASAQSLAGKNINMVNGFAAGGPIDLAARTLAPYLKKHTPGNPNFVVQNMPGANTFIAQNHVFAAKGDGENILFGSWFAVSQIVNDPAVRFKYQDFSLMGAGKTGGFLVLGNPSVVEGGMKSGADIIKAKRVHFPGQGPTNTFDLLGRMSLELFKVPYSYNLGYRGVADIRQALTQKEADIMVDSTTGYRSIDEGALVNKGLATVLWAIPDRDPSGAYVRNDTIPEIPTVVEVYRQAFGKEPSGIEWDTFDLVLTLNSVFTQFMAGPPNMDPKALADLRTGWAAALKDTEYQAETTKRFGYIARDVAIPAAQKVVASLTSLKPELVSHLKKHVDQVPDTKK